MGKYTKRIQKRMLVSFCIYSFLFVALFARIGTLSSSEALSTAAGNQSAYTLTVSQSRGLIYDCNGERLVAETKETVYLILPSADNVTEVLKTVPISRRESVLAQFQAGKPFLLYDPLTAPKGEGIYPFTTDVRYQEDQLAQHVIGYLDGEGNGVSGVEAAFDSFLSSLCCETTATAMVNGLGTVMSGVAPTIREETPSEAGIMLSIDKNIQSVIESIGKEMLKKGAIVVMDPYTGALKGVASFPDYQLSTLETDLLDTENTPMINRAFSAYAVGSTFKVVTTAAGLNAGHPMEETVVCDGYLDVSGQIFRCHLRSGHGEMDLLDALKESCNPYFITLGLSVGGDALLSLAKDFGFGEATVFCEGISSASGSLPSESEMINPAAVANFSFGQGALTATPVQIAVMLSAVVNGGYRVTPRLIEGEYDGENLNRYRQTAGEKILSSDVAAAIQSYLIYCVMVSEDSKAVPNTTTAGGKTATAQTGQYKEDGEEYEHGWFAGFFPAASPEYVVVVLSENSGFGNETAAPVFAAIADALTDPSDFAGNDS